MQQCCHVMPCGVVGTAQQASNQARWVTGRQLKSACRTASAPEVGRGSGSLPPSSTVDSWSVRERSGRRAEAEGDCSAPAALAGREPGAGGAAPAEGCGSADAAPATCCCSGCGLPAGLAAGRFCASFTAADALVGAALVGRLAGALPVACLIRSVSREGASKRGEAGAAAGARSEARCC